MLTIYSIPPDTGIQIDQFAAFNSDHYFSGPCIVVPEQWLEDKPEKYASGVIDILQPSLVGARYCIGKNLASGWF